MRSQQVLLVALCLCAAIAIRADSSETDQDDLFEDVASDHSQVITLTDGNFEHDTQAATGATTGDWLVEFYAPWCGHCKALAPIWEEVAKSLKGKVSVAKVDATENTNLAGRFKIRRFPTIILFKNKKMYEYEKGPRTLEDVKLFATKSYSKVEAKDVPPPMTAWELTLDELYQGLSEIKMLWYHKPEACGVLFSAGLLVGVFFALVIFITCIDRSDRGRPATPKAQKND